MRNVDCLRGWKERLMQPTSQPSATDPLVRIAIRLGIAVIFLSAIVGCQWTAQNANLTGVQMFQQGQYQAADMYFRQAIQNDPNNADGYYNLAANFHRQWKVHGRQSDLQQAESYYQQGLARNPQHADGYRGLAVLLVEQGKAQEAFALLDHWSASSPTSAEPRVELARLYEEFGDKENAKNKLIDAVALAPNNARALAALGKLREESGDPVQALANYQRSLTHNTNQPAVAARVAALQASGFGTPNFSAPGDTRWVNAPGAIVR
jgi:tetratricopeptide (TPR) repeat protein